MFHDNRHNNKLQDESKETLGTLQVTAWRVFEVSTRLNLMAPADSYAGLSALAFCNGLQEVMRNIQGLPTTAMHMSIA